MNKVISIILAIVFMLSLTACSNYKQSISPIPSMTPSILDADTSESEATTGTNSNGGSNNTSGDKNQGDNNLSDKNPIVIKADINNVVFDFTLNDIEASRQLIKKLPLSINMKDLNANEKYHYFSDTFITQAVGVGKINAGDFILYGNNCLVLFYESLNTSYSYTKLGKLNNPEILNELLNNSNDITIKLYIS